MNAFDDEASLCVTAAASADKLYVRWNPNYFVPDNSILVLLLLREGVALQAIRVDPGRKAHTFTTMEGRHSYTVFLQHVHESFRDVTYDWAAIETVDKEEETESPPIKMARKATSCDTVSLRMTVRGSAKNLLVQWNPNNVIETDTMFVLLLFKDGVVVTAELLGSWAKEHAAPVNEAGSYTVVLQHVDECSRDVAIGSAIAKAGMFPWNPAGGKTNSLGMSVEATSKQLILRWQPNFPMPSHGLLDIRVLFEGNIAMEEEVSECKGTHTIAVGPDKTYTVVVQCIPDDDGEVVTDSKIVQASLNKEETDGNYQKAMEFISEGPTEIRWFYKVKTESFYDDILEQPGQLLPLTPRGNKGQPGNRIKDLNGTFFSGRVNYGELPRESPYGDCMMKLAAEMLFNESHSLYFGGFYCYNDAHYLSLVISKKGSATEKFCNTHLKQLNNDNPFLQYRRNEDGSIQHFINCSLGLFVEMFLTEEVHISEGEFVRVRGSGSSSANSLLNNQFCTKCNFDPVPQVNCYCNRQAKGYISHTDINPGREFITCPEDSDKRCDFFMWTRKANGMPEKYKMAAKRSTN